VGNPLLQTLLGLVRKNQYKEGEHSWMVRRIFPTTSRMLEEREQVSCANAVALTQQQVQLMQASYGDVAEVIRLVVGLGGQMLSNVLLWCCGLDGGFREMLRLHRKFGWFNGDLKGYMQATKEFHNLVRNTDDVAWFEGIYNADH
jgi:hypothetical protein